MKRVGGVVDALRSVLPSETTDDELRELLRDDPVSALEEAYDPDARRWALDPGHLASGREALNETLGVVERGIDVLEEDKYSGTAPAIAVEAAALHESLHTYEDRFPDTDALARTAVDEVFNLRAGPVIEAQEEDGYTPHAATQNTLRAAATPRVEGGDADRLAFARLDEDWVPVDATEQETVDAVEILRKDKYGGFKLAAAPSGAWRARETTYEHRDGEWVPDADWPEDPTRETEIVRSHAMDVADELDEAYPGVLITIFGSGYNGTMRDGSDLESSLHLPADLVDVSRPVSGRDTEARDAVRGTVRSVYDTFVEEVADRAADDGISIGPGAWKIGVYDDDGLDTVHGSHYFWNGSGYRGGDRRFIYRSGDDPVLADFHDYLAEQGIEDYGT